VGLCAATVTPAFSLTGDFWSEKASMPTARGMLSAVTVDGKIYAIGGKGQMPTNEQFDPKNNTWIAKAPMPDPEQNFGIAVFEGQIYCLGTRTTKIYDPATDSWQTKTPMPTPRFGVQAQTIGNRIYLMGGATTLSNGSLQSLNINEAYDPKKDTWTTKSPLPNPSGYVSAVLDNKIYVVGSTTQIYDPQTDTWALGISPPIELSGDYYGASTACSTTGAMAPKRMYVYYGSTLAAFDPQNDSWTLVSSPPTTRPYLAIANYNDKLYFIGGFTNQYNNIPHYTHDYAENEEYTPIGYGTVEEAPVGELGTPTLVAVTVIATVAVSVTAVIIYLRKRKL
jgi:N-acetylneuraminic acid mutarotase